MHPSGPTVSVVLPFFNEEKRLPRALRSLSSQSYDRTEFILVNDGSTDNSLGIAQDFAQTDPRATVISKTNGGVSSSRNAGLEAATGEYVLFLDGDDWLEDEAIEKLVAFAENTDADCVLFNNFGHSPRGVTVRQSLIQEKSVLTGTAAIEDFQAALIAGIEPGYAGRLFVRTNTAESARFDEHTGYYEDLAYTLEILSASKVVGLMDEALFNYDLTGEGATRDPNRGAHVSKQALKGEIALLKVIRRLFSHDPGLATFLSQLRLEQATDHLALRYARGDLSATQLEELVREFLAQEELRALKEDLDNRPFWKRRRGLSFSVRPGLDADLNSAILQRSAKTYDWLGKKVFQRWYSLVTPGHWRLGQKSARLTRIRRGKSWVSGHQ